MWKNGQVPEQRNCTFPPLQNKGTLNISEGKTKGHIQNMFSQTGSFFLACFLMLNPFSCNLCIKGVSFMANQSKQV